ncbi:MAG: hypothetical protein HRU35_07085, partial [Rickettsiaceae bacterium]|nr:hypothetical protein [Rickettsiaceae bacterium]
MKNIYYLVRPFFAGQDKKYARIMGVALIILSLLKVYLGYLFTQWNRRFFDAIEIKNWEQFKIEMLFFCALALTFVSVVALSRYMCQRYALRWRFWMTNCALKDWLNSKNRELEGVDKRIQEDLMRFTDIFERICLEMVNNIVLVICFTPFLFQISQNILFLGISIQGILFYVVVVYTIIGFIVSRIIGRPLVQLEYDSQKYEAAFRYKLVHAKDGESFDVNNFQPLIQPIIKNHVSLYKRQKIFNFWQLSYDQLSFLIPYLILAPSYFSSIISLGLLQGNLKVTTKNCNFFPQQGFCMVKHF